MIHDCTLDGACITPPDPHPGAVLTRMNIPGIDDDDEAGIDEADSRYDDCVGYDACLDHVACLGWDAWSCHRCPAFEEIQVAPIDVTRLVMAFEIDHSVGE